MKIPHDPSAAHSRTTNESDPLLPTSSHLSPAYHTLPPITTQPNAAADYTAADNRARKRFFSALALGVVIYLVCGGGLGMGAWWQGERHHHHHTIQIPAIDHAVLCDGFVSPTKNSFERHTAFGLPLSSFDQMFFLSRGDYARGTLEVRRNSVGQTGEVMVKVKYKDERLMESVRVCLVRERKGDDWRTGISLWTPDRQEWLNPNDITFEIIYFLPAYLLKFGSLDIDTSNFNVVTSDLDGVLFDTVNIRTSNSPVTISSLNSTSGVTISTSNGAINADITAVERIQVENSNGAIEGKFSSNHIRGATSNGGFKGDFVVGGHLILAGSSQSIAISVSLVSSSSSSSSSLLRQGKNETKKDKSRFLVDVASSNGDVSVHYRQQPVDSHLDSRVVTSNGKANVLLSSNFEGEFIASTSSGRASLMGPDTLTDPLQHPHQLRQVSTSSTTPVAVSGLVYWSQNKVADHKIRERGVSRVMSSNGAVKVVLL